MTSPWKLDSGETIHLVTPEEFAALADGTALVCIDGEHVVKGTDPIDDDTRFGYLAFGLPDAALTSSETDQ